MKQGVLPRERDMEDLFQSERRVVVKVWGEIKRHIMSKIYTFVSKLLRLHSPLGLKGCLANRITNVRRRDDAVKRTGQTGIAPICGCE